MFNILVAEDDTNTRKWLAAVLRANGFNPVLAEDGQAALDLLDHYPVDLLIADIMMPRLDGLNLTSQLRASGSTLPVLMLTARQMPEDKRQGFLVGTDDYMVKPVDDEEMILRIRALLRRAKIVSERRLTVGTKVSKVQSTATTSAMRPCQSAMTCRIPLRLPKPSSPTSKAKSRPCGGVSCKSWNILMINNRPAILALLSLHDGADKM